MSSYKLENQFISHKIALELKEIGFNEPCFAYYNNHVDILYYKDFYRDNTNRNSKNIIYREDCTAPLYQQVFDYFQEEHKLFSSIRIGLGDSIWYDYMVESIDGRTLQIEKDVWLNYDADGNDIYGDYESSVYVEEDQSFETKKEAQIACILKLIELVKSK